MWKRVLMWSYVMRATMLLHQLEQGEQVSARKYNALLHALENLGYEGVAEELTHEWYNTLRELEV